MVLVTTGRWGQHILYRQQQEQVKQMMIVAINTTKMVTPMATVAPNPDIGSLSKLDRNFSAEPRCSGVSSAGVENLDSGSGHISSFHWIFLSTSEQQYWLEQEPQQKSGQNTGIELSSPKGLHSSPWAPGGGGSSNSSSNRVHREGAGAAMAGQTNGRTNRRTKPKTTVPPQPPQIGRAHV